MTKGRFFLGSTARVLLVAASLTLILPDAVHAGLSDGTGDGVPAATAEVSPQHVSEPYCSSGVNFTNGLKYETNDSSSLDVAVAKGDAPSKRPIVVLLTHQPSDEGKDVNDRAMCFAAEHGLAAFHVRIASRDKGETEGTRSVATALSWISDNSDLFGGNAREIVVVGFGAGASNLLDLLVHEGYRLEDDYIAGAVMLSGIFREGQVAGGDAMQRKLSKVGVPVVLGWSDDDPADLRAQNEAIRKSLCDAGHCPRTATVGGLANPASVFDLDGGNAALHERLRQLIGQLDARGLP